MSGSRQGPTRTGLTERCQTKKDELHETHEWTFDPRGGGREVHEGMGDERDEIYTCPGWTAEDLVKSLKSRLDAKANSLDACTTQAERLHDKVEGATTFAKGQAIRARALGHSDDERGWLDVVRILEDLR